MRTPLNVYIKKEYQGFAAITKFLAAIVQERPLFKKYFFNPKFAAIIQERPLFKSDRYWRGYGTTMIAFISHIQVQLPSARE